MTKSTNTRRAYTSAWDAFHDFCIERGIAAPKLNNAAPLVADYLTYLDKSGKRVSTINVAAAAIASRYRTFGLDDPTKREIVRRLLASIRNKPDGTFHRRTPIILDELARILDRLPATLAGRRDRALLLLGFAGEFRRSELVALNVANLHFTDAGLVVALRNGMFGQDRNSGIKHVPALKTLSPAAAVRAWLDAAGIYSGPVFRKVDRWDVAGGGRLGDRAVALIVKRAAAAAGLDPRKFSGDSLRAGFLAQEAIDLDALEPQP